MPVRYLETTAASGARNLTWVALNMHEAESPVRWAINKTGNGTFAADVQITLDNILDSTVSAVPFVQATVNVSATTATFNAPAAAVRLAITSASGHNSITFRVVQAGN